MKLPSPLEMDLLCALGSREVSGRELAKRYESEHGKSISYGSLYTTMRRLKETGWVEMREDEEVDRRVRYFKMTGHGISALQSLIRAHSIFNQSEVVI